MKILQHGRHFQNTADEEEPEPMGMNVKNHIRDQELSRCHKILRAMRRIPEAQLPEFHALEPVVELSADEE